MKKINTKNIPVTFANEMGWDVAELKLKMPSSDEWSDNVIEDDKYLYFSESITGINVTYDETDSSIDIYVADSTGESFEFNGVELPTDVEDIGLSFEHDKVTDSYSVQVMKK